MKFADLAPLLGPAFAPDLPDQKVWGLSFECPVCHDRVSLRVWAGKPIDYKRVWKISPDPSKESVRWNTVTIEPSIQEHAAPRQRPCPMHITVTDGIVENR